jgi:hypothetical protein
MGVKGGALHEACHPHFLCSSFHPACPAIEAVEFRQNTVSIDLLFRLVRPCIQAERGFESIENVGC